MIHSEARKLSWQNSDYRKKHSEAMKLVWQNPKYRKKNKGNLGYKHTKEAKKKMSLARLGKKRLPFSKEHRKKLSKAKKGTKFSEETKKRMSERMKGTHHSEETKRRMSESKKGRKGTMLGKHHSEKTKEKMRQMKINNPNRKFKDTSIELKVEEELKKRNIYYQKQVPLCNVAIVDFYLPEYRIIIQCDGDYYHNLIGAIERDERQDKILTFNGFNIYRFWEHEINKSVKNCIDRIKKNKI